MLSARRRRSRIVAGGAVACALLAGAAWGTADEWPFAPFSQYSGSAQPSSTYSSFSVTAIDELGRRFSLPPRLMGLRSVELAEQVEAHRTALADLLSLLRNSYVRLHADRTPLRRLILKEHVVSLRGGRLAGERARAIAWWSDE